MNTTVATDALAIIQMATALDAGDPFRTSIPADPRDVAGAGAHVIIRLARKLAHERDQTVTEVLDGIANDIRFDHATAEFFSDQTP